MADIRDPLYQEEITVPKQYNTAFGKDTVAHLRSTIQSSKALLVYPSTTIRQIIEKVYGDSSPDLALRIRIAELIKKQLNQALVTLGTH